MMRAIITIENPLNDYDSLIDYLRSAGIEAEWRASAGLGSQAFARLIQGFDAVIAGGNPFGADVLDAAKGSLKMIARYGIGVDRIDLDYAAILGIPVTNTPGTMSSAVAEMALALMLALSRRVCLLDGKLRAGDWWQGFVGSELEGKTVGLIGFGQIAQRLARYLSGFGCRLLATDVRFDAPAAIALGVEQATMPDLLRESDFVSVHVALLPETHRLANADFFAQMKRTALFVNTSRGAVVDEGALLAALRDGRIAGAALDVLDQEPPRRDHPLLRLDNVIVTPHMGAVTTEVFQRTARRAANNLIAFSQGRVPPDILNPTHFDNLTYDS